jgi:hypothetical protein
MKKNQVRLSLTLILSLMLSASTFAIENFGIEKSIDKKITKEIA